MESHEPKDFNPRGVQWTGVGLLALLLVIGLLLLGRQRNQVRHFNQTEVAPAQSPRGQTEFESGRLQQNLYLTQQEKLDESHWLDGKKEWAQVPFERALKLILERKSTELSFTGKEKRK